MSGNLVVLLHGIEKNTGAIRREDIDIARQRMRDFTDRMHSSPVCRRALPDMTLREILDAFDEVAADRQDAEAVRVAAYAGLWMGELLALRVGDVDRTGSVITVKRAISAGVERGQSLGACARFPWPGRRLRRSSACLPVRTSPRPMT